MAGSGGGLSAAFCGRTHRRWPLFTGRFWWQQDRFNAIRWMCGWRPVNGWRMSVNIYPGCLLLLWRPIRPTSSKQGGTP